MHHIVGVAALDELAEVFLEFGGLLEAAVGPQVVAEETVDGARNMATDRIEGFVLAAETVGCPGVNEQHGRGVEVAVDVVRVHFKGVLQLGREGFGNGFRRVGGERLTTASPSLDATVQNGHPIMSQPAQQPPQASGEHAAHVVVGHHLGVRADAKAAQLVGEQVWVG